MTSEQNTNDDTRTARVAYLHYLTDEFNRIWPYGTRRSSEWLEHDAFDKAKAKITALTKKIEEELL